VPGHISPWVDEPTLFLDKVTSIAWLSQLCPTHVIEDGGLCQNSRFDYIAVFTVRREWIFLVTYKAIYKLTMRFRTALSIYGIQHHWSPPFISLVGLRRMAFKKAWSQLLGLKDGQIIEVHQFIFYTQDGLPYKPGTVIGKIHDPFTRKCSVLFGTYDTLVDISFLYGSLYSIYQIFVSMLWLHE
jgi:hypothetical protein